MYVILAIPVLLLSMALWRRAAGTLSVRHLNMSTYPFYILLVTSFFGATLTVQGIVEQRDLAYLYDPTVLPLGWALVMYMMVMVPIGMILANATFGFDDAPGEIAEYQRRPIEPVLRWGETAMKAALFVALCLAVVALIFTWRTLDVVPLFNVLRGERDATLIAGFRQGARLNIAERPFFVSLLELFIGFTQVVALAVFAYWWKSRQRRDGIFLALAMLITVIALSYNATKTPILLFLSGLLVVMVAVRGSVPRWVVGAMTIAGIAGAVAMYVVLRAALGDGTIGLDTVVYNVVVGRIATGQLVPYFLALDIFPRSLPFIGFGSTGRLIHELLGLPVVENYGLAIMAVFDPDGVQAGTTGHATTIFMGEAWANFGWIGVLGAPLLVGWVIQAFHLAFVRARKTPLALGLYGYIAFNFTITSGIQGFYYPAWLIQLISVTAFVLVIAFAVRAIFLTSLSQRPHDDAAGS